MRTRTLAVFATLFLNLTIAAATHARITRIDIEKIESPTFGGASFGNTGTYEKITGKAYGELDPAHELNRNVALLDKAPRNAAGRVEYSVDILIMKPVDMSRSNRTLISGSRLMSINAPFGMPSRSPGHYGGDQFPHTYATVEDPISKKRDGWLARCTTQKACPRVMHMDSGTEAWLGRNALVITDASG